MSINFGFFNLKSSIRNLKFQYFLAILAILLYTGLPSGPLRAMPPVQRTILPNGLVLLVCEEHSLPFVTIQLLVQTGSWKDPAGQEGLSYLTARGLLLGTSKRDVNTLHEELDFMGASLSSSSGRDYATVNLQILKKDLNQGWDIFMDTLTHPVFPEEEIKREVEKLLAAIQSEEDQPDAVADKEFQKTLFYNNPYGHPVEGTKESIPRIDRDALTRFYGTYYHPNNAILTIVGDITSDEIKTKLLPELEKWGKAVIPAMHFKGDFAAGPQTVKINRDLTQANIILGHAGVSRDNPDYYALTVMNYILGGGGFSSRLFETIRNKRGLAYDVGSFFDPGKYPGAFQVTLQTKNASAREAVQLVLQEMERMQKGFVTEKELEGAKKFLIGSFPMRLNTQAKLTGLITQLEFFGLGFDYPTHYPTLIRSVTREDISRVAKKYLYPKNTILVVVGNLKETGM